MIFNLDFDFNGRFKSKQKLEKMKQFLLLTFFVMLGLSAKAQGLIIEYDYISKTSKYLKVNKKGDTVIVKSPLIRNEEDVVVKVINFNEHALYAEAEITSEMLTESTNPFGLFSMLSPIFNVASKGVLKNMFDEGGVDISDIDSEFGFTDDDDLKNDDQLNDVRADYVDLNEIAFDLGKMEQFVQDIEFGLNQLYVLSRNTNMVAEEVKEQARQIVSGTLKNSDNPKLTHFYRVREQLLGDSRTQLANAKLLASGIMKYQKYKTKENFGFSSLESAMVYEQMSEETIALMDAIGDFQSLYSKKDIEQMLQLMQQMYFSIQNSSFTYNTTAMAEGDRTNINLTFYDIPPIETIEGESMEEVEEEIEDEIEEEEDEYEYDWEDEEYEWEDDTDYDDTGLKYNNMKERVPIRTKSFRVKVSGGLKISPSVGMAFPSYFGAAKDFFARGDTIIAETDGDNWIPSISAFVNFYPYTGKAVNFGGSFGIGIPIKGGNISPNFYLGGALVLGDKYRVILSAGMATGPVTRLENGYEVDQKLETFQDIETTTKYAVGFYSSISFTMSLGGS